MDSALREIAVQIFRIGCLLFGNFTLKSGKKSAVYVDLRSIISFPNLMKLVGDSITKSLIKNQVEYELICGVPYTAIPIAAFVSVKASKPLSLRRKEAKTYGTKKMIEGSYKAGERCLVIEDVVTTGESILQTIKDLEAVGLVVNDVFVILARETTAIRTLKEKGYNVYCLFTLDQLIEVLKEENVLKPEEINLLENAAADISLEPSPILRKQLRYGERADHSICEMAIKLFTLMEEKKTNLCVAADLPSVDDIIRLATEVGPHICMLKLHLDIIQDTDSTNLEKLKQLADKLNFVILEDRKLCDIGNTVSLQYNRISKITGLVTAHSLPGYGVLKGIKTSEGYNPQSSGVFLIAEMSSEDNLIDTKYTEKTVQMGESCPSVTVGFVCQSSDTFKPPGFIQLTPGVSITESGDNLGQRYNSPETVIIDRGADIAVVGRAIYSAPDPAAAAKEYRNRLWSAYLERLSN